LCVLILAPLQAGYEIGGQWRNSKQLLKGTQISLEGLKDSWSKPPPETNFRYEGMIEICEEGYGPDDIGEFLNRSKAAVSYTIKNYDRSVIKQRFPRGTIL